MGFVWHYTLLKQCVEQVHYNVHCSLKLIMDILLSF